MTNTHRVNVGWTGDVTDLEQRVFEALGDVMIYEMPNKPHVYTFEIVTDKCAYEIQNALEDNGIDDVS